MIKVEVQLKETNQPIVYEEAINAYTKGPLYCVVFEKGGKRITHKFPVMHLFRVVEDYSESKR